MRLDVEFDSEWWRVRAWWHRAQCRITRHPGWRPTENYRLSTFSMFLGGFNPRRDELRCVRCHALHPDELVRYELEARGYTHSFVGVDNPDIWISG
jgi:hypothetical protein